jgi:hypothetical protein
MVALMDDAAVILMDPFLALGLQLPMTQHLRNKLDSLNGGDTSIQITNPSIILYVNYSSRKSNLSNLRHRVTSSTSQNNGDSSGTDSKLLNTNLTML